MLVGVGVQYSAVQYSAVQYGTVQYSTVQYSIAQFVVEVLKPGAAERFDFCEHF